MAGGFWKRRPTFCTSELGLRSDPRLGELASGNLEEDLVAKVVSTSASSCRFAGAADFDQTAV